jgi:hypothetical protein
MTEKQKLTFTVKEIRALVDLRRTLRYLLEKHTRADLVKKLRYFAKKAGFVPGSKLYNPRIEKKLLTYEAMIASTLISAQKLVSVLTKIINKNMNRIVDHTRD